MKDFPNIIEEIKNGNVAILREVYSIHKNEFVQWASHEFNLSTDDAKEAFQFAMVVFYENVKNGKLEVLTSSLKTYLFAIGKNKAMEFNRRKNKLSGLSDLQMEHPDDSETEDEEREREERLEKAKKSLIKLGSPCSEILNGYYYQKKPLAEIATTMGYKSMESLKSQKYKCMERLRSIYFAAA